jgi:hypothetical protein
VGDTRRHGELLTKSNTKYNDRSTSTVDSAQASSYRRQFRAVGLTLATRTIPVQILFAVTLSRRLGDLALSLARSPKRACAANRWCVVLPLSCRYECRWSVAASTSVLKVKCCLDPLNSPPGAASDRWLLPGSQNRPYAACFIRRDAVPVRPTQRWPRRGHRRRVRIRHALAAQPGEQPMVAIEVDGLDADHLP